MARQFAVYILANKPKGTLYVGISGNLARRLLEHQEGVFKGFTKRYGIKRLVYVELHETALSAIQREKKIKHWPRAWKFNLIESINPDWADISETLLDL